jgi:glycosyltransferase involved in cell wall biosynthesis
MSADHATVPVTVLLPVYNGGAHLRTAVESILGQTHEAFELLIIDDGSTDCTADLLADLTDPRVTVVTQPNHGLVATLNTGLSLASHDLVARMDADDVSHPRRLELQIEHLTTHPDVAAVGCCYEVVDDLGAVVTRVHTAADPPYLRRQLFFRNVLPHAGMMFRRSAVVAVGGYRDVGPVEDYDLWARLSAGYELASLPHVLLSYRLSSSGISASAGDGQIRHHRLVRNRMVTDGTFPHASAVHILREGLQHARNYEHTCPGALRSYVFDHIWLAALLTRGGRLRTGSSLMTGAVALAVLRPRAFVGFLDVARNAARRLLRGRGRYRSTGSVR